MNTGGIRAGAACLLALGLPACAPDAADSQGSVPTPELTEFQFVEYPGVAYGYAMVGQLGELDARVGLTVMCYTDGSQSPLEVGAFFGAFPGDRRAVQMAVRDAAGTVERFGRAVTAGPESGFHSPRLTDPAEAERFARIALQPDALVSNGYNSFWNRANAEDNQAVLEALLACARGEG